MTNQILEAMKTITKIIFVFHNMERLHIMLLLLLLDNFSHQISWLAEWQKRHS
jgi:hypothetical protein